MLICDIIKKLSISQRTEGAFMFSILGNYFFNYILLVSKGSSFILHIENKLKIEINNSNLFDLNKIFEICPNITKFYFFYLYITILFRFICRKYIY